MRRNGRSFESGSPRCPRAKPRIEAVLVLLLFAASPAAWSQTLPSDQGWWSSEKLVLHGSPRKGSWLFLRDHPETGAKVLRVVLIIESGKEPQFTERVDLVLDGDRESLDCRVVGRQNVSVRIDAEPIDVQLATMHATSDCALEPALFDRVQSAAKIEVAIEASGYPLKAKSLGKKLVRRLRQLEPAG